MTLSHGEVIWDFAGNVWQWVDWSIPASKKAYVAALGIPYYSALHFQDLFTDPVNTAVSDPMAVSTWSPYNSALSTEHNIGRYWVGGTGAAVAVRGGYWTSQDISGIYSLSMYMNQNSSQDYLGFRCVYTLP